MNYPIILTEEIALSLAQKPNNFRWYTGERVRGVLASNGIGKWYFLEQKDSEPWTKEMLNLTFIIDNGREIDLSELQIDLDPYRKDHFYKVPAGPINSNFKFKKMIILGAGASFDCLSDKSSKLPVLPLSNDIFKSDAFGLIDNIYPAVSNKFSNLARTSNLESYLTNRWKRLYEKPNREELAELMNIQFYLHHLFLSFSNKYYGNIQCNYRALVDHINDYCNDTSEKVAVVSYNYDCLFEQALEKRYPAINGIEDYLSSDNRPVSLFKPHGSCDWVRPIKREFNYLISRRYTDRIDIDIPLSTLSTRMYWSKLSLADIHNITSEELLLFHSICNDKIKYFQRELDPQQYTVAQCYWPNLLLPFNEKDEFVMPFFHTNQLDQILEQVEHIEVIGWKSEEKTMLNKFKDKIGERSITITVVDKPLDYRMEPDKNEIAINLKKFIPNATIQVKNMGFSGYLDELVDNPELFLGQNH